MNRSPVRERWIDGTAWFLAVSYGVGAPVTAFLEYRGNTFSRRFDLPPSLIFVTVAVQFGCAFAVRRRSTAAWAAAALTITTLGAIAAHLRIGSPLTSLAAVAYTMVQTWFGRAIRARARRSG